MRGVIFLLSLSIVFGWCSAKGVILFLVTAGFSADMPHVGQCASCNSIFRRHIKDFAICCEIYIDSWTVSNGATWKVPDRGLTIGKPNPTPAVAIDENTGACALFADHRSIMFGKITRGTCHLNWETGTSACCMQDSAPAGSEPDERGDHPSRC